MRCSYRSATAAVIGVRITPGLTSNTAMSWAASRSANNRVTMARPAFDTQYSPRSGEASSALTEEIVTIERGLPAACAAMCRATAWVKKKVPRKFTAMT